jgi:molybdopterin-guanine dinucleotide biosynthesis protein A
MSNVIAPWLEWLLERAVSSDSGANALRAPLRNAVPLSAFVLDGFIPDTNRGLEPLCAVYRAACASKLAAALDSGVRKVTEGLARINTEIIGENVWRKFSPDGSLFQNLNTWEDYVSAKKHLES